MKQMDIRNVKKLVTERHKTFTAVGTYKILLQQITKQKFHDIYNGTCYFSSSVSVVSYLAEAGCAEAVQVLCDPSDLAIASDQQLAVLFPAAEKKTVASVSS
jgi:hypothetical protein